MEERMEVKGKRIYVGLSGGVDSAVSAALLKEQGAQVTGVFIKGWYPPDMPCTWAAERRDAMRVAARLRIPFITLDASEEYKKSVIDYLISEYRAGRTPNPDVMCNKEVKFGAFYRFAKNAGADAIATGHYRSGEKDQSYFLWAVPKEILAEVIFPVGYMEKSEVRALAKRFNIPVAEKKDSQGICFLGAVSVKDFLKKELWDDNPALLHTLGQKVSRPDGPWYVVGKDVEKREIMVSKTRASATHTIYFTDANWHQNVQHLVLNIFAQYRYRGPRIKGNVEGESFIPSEPLPDIPAPGQSIVFYRDDERRDFKGAKRLLKSKCSFEESCLIGGGIIEG